MRKLIAWVGAAQLVALGWLVWAYAWPATAESTSVRKAPIIVELFTSQGCSSCPPADRVLSKMSRDPAFADVYALSFHVDYWDYIGWKDPFSSNKWSARQRQYASTASSQRVYTPQAIVGGKTDCVGSRIDCLSKAVKKSRSAPAKGHVEVLRSRLIDDGAALEIQLKTQSRGVTHPVRVLLAVHSSGLSTKIARGENRGKILRNDNVVRSLTEAMVIPANDKVEHNKKLRLPLESSWKADHLGVTAFLQNARTLEIIGASRAKIQ